MADARSVSTGFYVLVTGQIDGCQMTGYDNLYVKYSFTRGHDWSVLAGVEHGVSQIAKRTTGATDVLTWNYPIDIMFRSSNVHGWPQVVIGVYGLTVWGGDVIRGYGCTHVPTTPGRHTKYIQLYTPISSSLCQRFTAWLTNNPPEFFDSKFISQGRGREVTRVRSHGCVKVTFNVTTKNMSEWGYQVSAERAGDVLRAQAAMGPLGASASPTASVAATPQQVPRGEVPRTTLSSSTTASLATARSRASTINPPSGSSSRETSLVRRGGGGVASSGPASARDANDDDDEDDAKYPSTVQPAQLSHRTSPSMRPTPLYMGVEMQPTVSGRLQGRERF